MSSKQLPPRPASSTRSRNKLFCSSMEPQDEFNVHHRALKLKDIALGVRNSWVLNSKLSSASYDCALDSLCALHSECESAGTLAKDKNVQKFTKKYGTTVAALKKLRISADDFRVKSTIGRGHFGEVVVCHEKSTGDVFAMKIMKKTHILQQSDTAFFQAERDIMAWSTSPWHTSLHYAFQDDKCLYLVMDFHPGGDLLNVMERRESSMQEEDVRFYLAEMAAGLSDLHQLGFVHRDLKPDNVLITRSGHIKLVDFGSVAVLSDQGKVLDAQLPVGTTEYIAPEVLTSLNTTADYGTCCDWWSLGVVAYELLYEATPFEGDATSKIYNNIMNYKNSLTFPEEPRTSLEQDIHLLIKALLTDKDKRLDYEGIRCHSFFAQTDWDHLLEATPPYIPRVTQPDDVSNFDTFDPLKDDDLKYPAEFQSRKSGFSGRSLPFIGFTFNRHMTTLSEFTAATSNGEVALGKEAAIDPLKDKPSLMKKELDEARQKAIVLEQECEVYRSQLEDYHRRLEMERSDRRVSDSRALELLREVKEKGKTAQQLREDEVRNTKVEYDAAVKQLEKERKEASTRAKKLQQRLKEMQKERDGARGKLSGYKHRLTELKESSGKEIAELQGKVVNLTGELTFKLSEGQKRFQDIHKRYTEALDKIKMAENAKKKAEFGFQKLQTNLDQYSTTTADINQQLTELKSINDSLQSKVDSDSKASDDLRNQSVVLSKQVTDLEAQLEEACSEKNNLRASQQSLEDRVEHLLDQLKEKKIEMQEREDVLQELRRSTTEERRRKDEMIAWLEEDRSVMKSRLAEMKTKSWTSPSKKLKAKLEVEAALEKEKEKLTAEADAMGRLLEVAVADKEALEAKLQDKEQKHAEALSEARGQLSRLQKELGESKNASFQQEDQMREARKAKREADQNNESLTVLLKEQQRECKVLKKQLKDCRCEVEQLCTAQDRLKQAQTEIEILKGNNETLRSDAASTQQFIKELTASSEQAHSLAYSYKNKFDAQEMNVVLLSKKASSLEQELEENRASLEEMQKQVEKLNEVRQVAEKDLETAEVQLDKVSKSKEGERKDKLELEQKLSGLAADMEQVVVEHSEELRQLSGQLATQKNLSSKYSDKVLEAEKALRVKALSLREVQRELTVEKTVSSRFYDEITAKSRELCKLKAAHMKLVREAQERNSALAQREQSLRAQQQANEEHLLHKTRLQATVSQQTKLINYLQGNSDSPRAPLESKGAKGLGKIKKGLKLGRKRDPVKDITEWNKLKGIARKGVTQSTSATSIASTSSTSSSHTQPPLPPSSSFLSTMSVESCTVTLSTDMADTHIVSLTEDSSNVVIDVVDRPLSPATEVISGNGEVVTSDQPSRGVAQHNIPHRFNAVSKSSRRSRYTCDACNGPIKSLQKLNKCDYCSVMCHSQCIASIPNNCCLPEEMSALLQSDTTTAAEAPAAKRPRLSPSASLKPNSTTSASTSSTGPKKRKPGRKKKNVATTKKPVVKIFRQITKTLSGDLGSEETGNVQPDSNGVEITSTGAEMEDEDPIGLASTDLGDGGSLVLPDGGVDAASSKAMVSSSRSGFSSPAASEGMSSPPPVSVKIERIVQNIYYSNFDSSKVVKMEKITHPRSGILAEGWLVLTHTVLSYYDRNPRGVTRKPIHRFVLDKPGTAFIVITSIGRSQLPTVPSSAIINAFGLEVLASYKSRMFLWVAPNLQSKIEWVEELQKVLGQHSSPARGGGSGSNKEKVLGSNGRDSPLIEDSKGKESASKGSSRRLLKEVKVVPLPTPPSKKMKTNEENENDVTADISVRSSARRGSRRTPALQHNLDASFDLSIRSSMLDTSSESSFI